MSVHALLLNAPPDCVERPQGRRADLLDVLEESSHVFAIRSRYPYLSQSWRPPQVDPAVLFVTNEKQQALTQYRDHFEGELLHWGQTNHIADQRMMGLPTTVSKGW